jgi:hypothetical protein
MTNEDGDNSMDIVDKYECYIKVDIDGDGIAETCRVIYAGSQGWRCNSRLGGMGGRNPVR